MILRVQGETQSLFKGLESDWDWEGVCIHARPHGRVDKGDRQKKKTTGMKR